ncbi:MAG: hypothetical protein LBH19_01095 [Dysgonamonadaceae bacterium]|jgi:hypothetical protein|nr:hypothetical protein [Dysgonamonadaceae bacterium]
MKLRPLNKENIQEKTKAFFHGQKWKDLLVFLVFVGIAFAFWLMQYFQQTSQYDALSSSRNPYSETGIVGDSLHGKGKEIPVRINGTLSLATGSRLVDSLHIEPSEVWIYGDKNILDTLQWINTVSVKETGLQKNIDLLLKLQAPKGLRVSPQKVRVTAELEEYAEKKFELSITCAHLPDDLHVRFFPSSVEIICYVSLNDYASLKAEDLTIGVDYNELAQNEGVNIQLAMLRKPQWLDDYRILPETVEYLIEQKRRL